MLTRAHIEKFRRMDRMLMRLEPEADRELWIWTAMNGLTHLLNAALHEARLTREVDSFHSQVEGLYCVPDRANGLLVDAMHAPGDVMHLGRPPIPAPLPGAIMRAGAALKVLEDLRVPYVRGDDPVPSGAADQWLKAYAECITQLSNLLGTQLEIET